MVGNAIGAGIQGFFAGKDWREGRDDREAQRERQKRLDDLVMTQDSRAAEEHARRMAVFDREAAAAQREQEEEAYWRGIYGAAAGATSDAILGAAPQPAAGTALPGASPVVSTSGGPQPAIPGMPVTSVPGLGAAVSLGASPQMTVPPAPSAAPFIPSTGANLSFGLPSPAAPIGRMATPGPATPAAMTGPADAPLPDTMDAKPAAIAALDRQIAERQAQLQTQGFPARDIASPGQERAFEETQRAIADLQTQRQKAMEATTWTGQDTRNGAVQPPTSAVPAVPLSFGAAPPKPASPLAPQQTQRDAAPAATSTDEKRLAQTSASALGAASPAIAATDQAAAAAGDASLSAVRPNSRGGLSDEKRQTAAKDWMTHYAEVGAPMVIEAMLGRGELDRAIAFQEFIDSKTSQAAMKNWAEGVIAAQLGDMDTFADKFITVMNNTDYAGGDLTVERNGTDFIRDEATNSIIGARIVFKDTSSGNTFEQIFNNPQDMIDFGVLALSPEQMFDRFEQRAAAQGEAQLGARDAAKEEQDAMQKRIDAMAKTIMETSIGTTPEQAMAQATALVMNPQGAAQASPQAALPPPVMYRP